MCSVHIIRAANEQWRALMQLRGLDVEDALRAIGRRTARLLDDESEWIRLVKKTELAALVSPVGGISEQSAAEEIAMEIRHE